jgi:hypothetical protein
VQLIDANDNVSDVCAGTNLATVGNTLYVLDAPYGATNNVYTSYSVASNGATTQLATANLEDIVSASCFSVNPINNDVYVGSYSLGDYGYADYTADGYINVYDATTGAKKTQVAAGVGPCALIFK